MDLSVLIATHNARLTLIDSVKSALKNLPSSGEVIVYFDGFDSVSIKKLGEINDQRLKILFSETNQGVISTRNSLLNAANGKYVSFLDSDDLVIGRRFSKQLKFLSANPGAIVFTNAIFYHQESRYFKLRPALPFQLNPHVSKVALTLYDPFVHSTMMASKDTLLKLGGYRNSASEDYDLWIRAALADINLVKLNIYGAIYRVHQSQMTQQNEWKTKFETDQVIKNSLDELKNLLSLRCEKNRVDLRFFQKLLYKSSKKAYLEYKVYS